MGVTANGRHFGALSTSHLIDCFYYLNCGAGDRGRTGDVQLGKEAIEQNAA